PQYTFFPASLSIRLLFRSPILRIFIMSDLTTSIDSIQPVVESSGSSIWGYVIGGIVLVLAAGYFGFKKMNQPAFVIKQLRKRNRKEMQKQGVESAESMADLDLLL